LTKIISTDNSSFSIVSIFEGVWDWNTK